MSVDPILPPASGEDVSTLPMDEVQRRFQAFQAASAAGKDFTAAELRQAIELTRILRRTNTGPGKAKTQRTAKAAKAAPLSLDDL